MTTYPKFTKNSISKKGVKKEGGGACVGRVEKNEKSGKLKRCSFDLI